MMLLIRAIEQPLKEKIAKIYLYENVTILILAKRSKEYAKVSKLQMIKPPRETIFGKSQPLKTILLQEDCPMQVTIVALLLTPLYRVGEKDLIITLR
jgi:hypothetical protein